MHHIEYRRVLIDATFLLSLCMIYGYIDILCNFVDTNECAEQDICGQGNCSNTVGAFVCTCDEGFEAALDGKCKGTLISYSY